MKKAFLILAVTAVVALAFGSCGSTKPPCPAYKTAQVNDIPADQQN